MAGGFINENDPAIKDQLRGWKFYLNSYTMRGRFNWVVLTYGTIFGLVALKKLFSGKKKIEAK